MIRVEVKKARSLTALGEDINEYLHDIALSNEYVSDIKYQASPGIDYTAILCISEKEGD